MSKPHQKNQFGGFETRVCLNLLRLKQSLQEKIWLLKIQLFWKK
jgi:hypothetical protein